MEDYRRYGVIRHRLHLLILSCVSDIQGTFASILNNLDGNNVMAAIAKPGNFNDPDSESVAQSRASS